MREASHSGHEPRPVSPGQAVLIPCAAAAILVAFGMSNAESPGLFRAFVLAAGTLAAWSLAVYLASKLRDRSLFLEVSVRKHHWVQTCAQLVVLFYWGWYIRVVYAFIPLILAQLVFAYGVDSLLTWSRRDRYFLGFGPVPVVLSINLFLWFRPDWFHWQFGLILLGYLGKELIRWERDGRWRHIFNPSSLPLSVSSLVLILTASSDVTFGNFIANSQHDPPFIYLVIFLAAIPGQLLFGVASMTMAAVVTMCVIGFVFLGATGTYLFYDAFIPVPVFLGMHLILTDPSTSPRSELGRLMFGSLYACLAAILFVVLRHQGIPTFYDKLLPVPLLNLMVRRIDWLATGPLARLDPARLGKELSRYGRYAAYTSVWAGIFALMASTQVLGDRHPGQYLPFWMQACADGSDRACSYAAYLTLAYCNNGSGWACNEAGVHRLRAGESPQALFHRSCELGFPDGCRNEQQSDPEVGRLARAGPRLEDLPIVLRGTKPPLTERDPERLYALACDQGWSAMCAGPS